MAIIIDATFDVALEGPMLGIWFWCLVGFGIGSVMIYRAQYQHHLESGRRISRRIASLNDGGGLPRNQITLGR